MRTIVPLLAAAVMAAGCPPSPPPQTGPTSAPTSCPTSLPAPPATRPAEKAQPGPLVLRGTPPVPGSLKRSLGRYLDVRYADLADLAADGTSMLVATRFARTQQIHLVQQPLGTRQQLTFAAEPVKHARFVPGAADQLLYMSDVGGNEQYQIFHMDLTSGQTTMLSDGKSRHGGYVWSHDGKRIAYTSNARNGKDMDIYLGDGRSQSAGALLLERKGHWFPIDWSHDGKHLLIGQYISINDTRLFIVDVESKKVTRVSPPSPLASYRNALFSRHGRKLYVTTDREGEFVELFEVDLAGKSWKPLTRKIRWNVEGLALSPDGRRLAFTTNEDGHSTLRLLDTRSGRYREATGIPRGIIVGLRYARQAAVLGFSLLGPTRTGDAYTYSTRRRRLTRWTRSEVGGLNPDRFVEPELVRYKTFDGRKIPAFYYRPPKSAGPFPVMVYIHGGPEAQARPYFSALVQYLLLESNVAVLVPNVRGSDGYGKSYLLLDNGFKREDSVKDIGSLLDWIATRRELNSKRVAVFGGSYGGYMVLAALTHFPQRIVAGVDIVGISNFVTFLKNTRAYRRDLRRAEYGDERDPKMREFLQKISPNNNVEQIKSALFVAHGANDPRVPLSETDQMVEAVRRQGQDVWYMVAMNEGHGFRKKDNRDLFYYLTVMFLNRHLQGAK